MSSPFAVRHGAESSFGWRLLKKKLGFRMLMDVIPLDASLVKGSHGRIPEDEEDWPVLIGDFNDFPESGSIRASEVHDLLLQHCSEGHGYKSATLI